MDAFAPQAEAFAGLPNAGRQRQFRQRHHLADSEARPSVSLSRRIYPIVPFLRRAHRVQGAHGAQIAFQARLAASSDVSASHIACYLNRWLL